MNQQALWPPVFYLAGVLLVIGVAIAIIAAIRRWVRSGNLENEQAGLTLGQVRQMKARGLLTQEEFDELKRVIIEGSQKGSSGGEANSAL